MKKSKANTRVKRTKAVNETGFTRKVTLANVADAAGVSLSTASRILNGTSRVRDSKTKAVKAAIAELGYEPNPAAQWLARGKTGSVGVVAQQINSPYYGEALAAIEKGLLQAGYSPMFVSGHFRASDERRCIDHLLRRRVDGIILLTSCLEDPELVALSERVPLVLSGRKLATERVFSIDADSTTGAKLAASYLIELGHRKIAYISGPDEHQDARQRFNGYKSALSAHRIRFEKSLIVTGDYREMGGFIAMNELIERKVHFTAVFAANDQSAYGAMLALYKRGIRVPDAVSLVGYDDLPYSKYTSPPLTTIHRFINEVGEAAATAIVDLIELRRPIIRAHGYALSVRESAKSLLA